MKIFIGIILFLVLYVIVFKIAWKLSWGIVLNDLREYNKKDKKWKKQ